MATIEEALKPLFNQWLAEVMPEIKEEVRQELQQDMEAKAQQTLFNQTEIAKRQGVSVETFRKWRVMGLQAEPNPTGKLLFDLNKVNQWRKDNTAKKEL
ncbi:hypothetical protein M222_2247 [Enterococcus faecalis AZ19]|uniref:hypothetical protein n=1 Tax=Enterococcus faecalis TaxID=1351 RepID=UPI000459FDE7|nr:hypothetical protein [Enterococcus faecalis]KAJ72477.1 hypothetical protein M222_2247 [Enterococcus faecalis AZ19]